MGNPRKCRLGGIRLNLADKAAASGSFGYICTDAHAHCNSRQPEANVLVQRNVCLREHRREKKIRLVFYLKLFRKH
ncbi:hypothetical protein AABM17_2544 [Neisseria musculi]|uniref:Uncharacterized protein n=1 Tax=Neisseria musculi TaxID=1815583 RepID=A0A7H1MEN3_9NEIS|nr:hypothetical protein H7A79_2544 [Neisseria musculi]